MDDKLRLGLHFATFETNYFTFSTTWYLIYIKPIIQNLLTHNKIISEA